MNYFKGLDINAKKAAALTFCVGIILGAMIVAYSTSTYILPCTP